MYYNIIINMYNYIIIMYYNIKYYTQNKALQDIIWNKVRDLIIMYTAIFLMAVSSKIPGTSTMLQSTSTKKSFTINLLLYRVILVHTTLKKRSYHD